MGDAPYGDDCGSGSTCWRRLRDWEESGAWRKLHRARLDRLGEADKIGWSWASLDPASLAAKGGEAVDQIRRIAENWVVAIEPIKRPKGDRGSDPRSCTDDKA